MDPAQPPANILDNADQALYYAKGNGRNRTCHYESLVETGQIARRDNMEGNASVDFDIDALFG